MLHSRLSLAGVFTCLASAFLLVLIWSMPAMAVPDLGVIAFVSDGDGYSNIYIMNADGSGQRRLTNDTSSNGAPAFSPDGSKIVFASYREGHWEIYQMNADGTEQQNISHDGVWAHFPVYSADGSKIAFCSFRDGNAEIYVMNADGSNQTRVTNNLIEDRDPAISFDGETIIFSSWRNGNWDLYRINADGTGEVKLTNSPFMQEWEPVFSPDGAYLAYTLWGDGSYRTCTMQADGSQVTYISAPSDQHNNPAFSPDGTHFTISSFSGESLEIYTMSVDGSNLTRLTNNLAADSEPTWGAGALSPLLDLDAFTPASGPVGTIVTITGSHFTDATAVTFNGVASVFTVVSSTEITALVPAGATTGVIAVTTPDGTATSADPFTITASSAGRIAFISDRDGNMEIYVMEADGSNQTRLTDHPAWDGFPAISADGRKVVFVSERDGTREIYTVELSTGTLTRISNDVLFERMPSFSPDGQKIAYIASEFSDSPGELYVMNADGTGVTRLTDNACDEGDPFFSPDGSNIVFGSSENPLSDIYLMNVDGSNRINLTNTPAVEVMPTFSPDGSKIAFSSDRDGDMEIYLMNADGSNPTRLTQSPGMDMHPCFSPDGTKIAFMSDRGGDSEIYQMHIDGTGQEPLTDNSALDYWPTWSRGIPAAPIITSFTPASGPIGTTVTITGSNFTGATAVTFNGTEALFTVVSATEITTLVPAGATTGAIAVTTPTSIANSTLPFTVVGAQNDHIVFTSERDGNSEIYVMHPDGSAQTRLTNNSTGDFMPAFSRDGSKIVFKSDRDGNYEIYVMNADGSGQTRLTANSCGEYTPTFSPNGEKILFVSDEDGDTDIYVMNADGSQRTRLTDNTIQDFDPVFSPDGGKIVYSALNGTSEDIFIMNADGSNRIQLTDTPTAADIHPTFNPNGEKITFASNRTGYFQIYTMDANGDNLLQVTDGIGDAMHPWFNAGGDRITFAGPADGPPEIYVINADGSNQTRLTVNNAFDDRPNWSWGTFSTPIITGFTPTSGPVGTTVTITGSNFTDASVVTFNGVASDFTVISATEITAVVPTGVTTGAIAVTTPDGTATSTDSFTVTAPSVHHIVFMSDRSGKFDIYQMNPDGTGVTPLTTTAADDVMPAVSRDGSKIVFASFRDGFREIYCMDTDGGNQTRLTFDMVDNVTPDFSPNGDHIVYGCTNDGNQEIYVMDADGANPVRLTNNAAEDLDPHFSPDGSNILFSSDRGGTRQLYVMDADGDNQTALTSGDTENWQPAYNPDGNTIAFVSSRDGTPELYLMNADGTNQVRLTTIPGNKIHPSFNPDGSKIAFMCERDGSPDIFVIEVDGSNLMRLTETMAVDDWPSWGIGAVAVNHPPTAVDDHYETPKDIPLTILAPGVLDNDTDADGDFLSVELVSNPLHGEVTLNVDGSFTYTPQAGWAGTDMFLYQTSEGTVTSEAATVTITVVAPNDPPIVMDDMYITDEDVLLTVSAPGVLWNDTDLENDPLSVSLVTPPSHGTLTLQADGSFTYQPDANWNSGKEPVVNPTLDSFTYHVNDTHDDSAVATVTIRVNAVNDPPVAGNDDGYTVAEDSTLTVSPSAGILLLANDTDLDGDTLLASVVTNPAHGTLTLHEDGSFIYTPTANWHGTDTFTYRVFDGEAYSTPATVAVVVTSVNDAPVAVADAYAVNENATLTVALPGVLANDSDVEGSALTAIKVSDPQHGQLALQANGAFTYTPTADWYGTDSFSYKARDGQLDSSPALVTITVSEVNHDPVAVADSASTFLGVGVTIPVLANDTDADGDTLSIVGIILGEHGSIGMTGNTNPLTYTPFADWVGADTFGYTISDGHGGTSTTTVTVTTYAPLTAVALAATPPSPRLVNTPLTLTATPTGGKQVEYRFFVSAGGAAYVQLRAYGVNPQCPYTPASPGAYTFLVYAREVGHNVARDCYTTLTYTVKPPLTAVNLTAAPQWPQPPGTPLTLTATPVGGVNVEYRFYVAAPGGPLAIVQPYSAVSTYAFTPTVQGTYQFLVYAREVGSPNLKDCYKSITYTVATPITGVALTVTPPSPQLPNTPVQLSATATGGFRVQYRFFVSVNGAAFTVLPAGGNYTNSNTCAYTPVAPGRYTFMVYAREVGSVNSKDAYITASYTVNGGVPLTAVSLAAAPSPGAVNTPVTLTATPTGGMSVEYRFFVSVNGGAYTQLRGYNTLPTCAYTPTATGSYAFLVWARESGHTTTKDCYTTLNYTVP